MIAVNKGYDSVVRYCIDIIDINLNNHCGLTALMSAAANGHLFAVDLLLNRGAQIDAKDHQDKVVELLLVRGSDVNTVNKCRESA